MLRLDDPRWSELHAEGRDNRAWVPRWLHRLLEVPDDISFFESDCWMLCCEEITWSAGFAAAPHLVEVACRAKAPARIHYVCFLGSLAMYRVPPKEAKSCCECPPDLEEGFREAITAAHEMAIELLPTISGEADLRGLLGAIAAFKGFSELARAINDLGHDVPQEDIPF